MILAWTVVVSATIAGGGVLQALGPPPESADATVARPEAARINPAAVTMPAAQPHAQHPHVATAKGASPATDAIPALLARVEAQIADNPDSPPSGEAAAEALARISAALPEATPDDRERAKDLAAELFDRAKTALRSGKVDEEQRWLALGSVLAPPPDIGPDEMADAAGQEPDAGSATRQDFTPNEAEADQAVADRQAGPAAPPATSETKVAGPDASATANPASSDPAFSHVDSSAVPGTKATVVIEARQPDQHRNKDLAPRDLPALRPPNARPAMLGEARVEQAAPLNAALPAAEPAREQSAARSWRVPIQSDFGQSVSPGAEGALWRRRVVIHYPANSGPAASEADQIAASLAAKAGTVEIRAVNAVPRSPTIRYFHEEDLPAAETLEALLRNAGGQWATRAFTAYEPKPRPGTIEVWIANG